jgi:broad specificity phosphatase PhoE
MPTTVLLIRHPESDWNRSGIYQGRMDIPLSPLGRAQARLVGLHLSGHRIAGILSSPLQRARTLAGEIAAHHRIKPRVDERLTEIAHGVWECLPRHEVQTRFPDLWQVWQERPHDVTFPGGESLRDVHHRAVGVVADLLAAPRDETWVVVTHDTVARLVVAAARDEPLVGFSSVALENGGITTLEGPDLSGSVRALNAVDHLGAMRVDLERQAL